MMMGTGMDGGGDGCGGRRDKEGGEGAHTRVKLEVGGIRFGEVVSGLSVSTAAESQSF